MCESFERLADKVAEERAEQVAMEIKADAIKHIMEYYKCSLEEALNALNILGKERATIAQQLQKTV